MGSRLGDWNLSTGTGEILQDLFMAERLRSSELRLRKDVH